MHRLPSPLPRNNFIANSKKDMTNRVLNNTHKGSAWEEHKRKLKEKFPTLTNADLHFEPGKSDDMFRKVMLKTGKSKRELATIIATFIAEYNQVPFEGASHLRIV